MDTALFNNYVEFGFKPIRCYGYSASNAEKDPEKRRKQAKVPIDSGYNTDKVPALSLNEVLAWEKSKGWPGWLLPPGVVGIDVEDPTKIYAIKRICQKYGINPPEDQTPKGIHLLFSDPEGIAGATKKETKLGFQVTYRAGGKNILILPDTEGRTWTVPLNGTLPEIPAEFRPWDDRNIDDVSRALAWAVGEAYLAQLLQGYEDLDLSFTAYLTSHGMNDDQIHTAFEICFLQDYDFKRTQDVITRTRNKQDSGQKIVGPGSFIKAVHDRDLKTVNYYISTFEGLTGYSQKTEWLNPIPFDSFSSLPEYPVEALPDIGREFVESVASVNQVDLGLPASIYLGVLSVCAAKKIEVDLKTHKEPANLYLCSILDSGQRKTSTMSVMTAPIYEYEKTLAANMREAILKSRNRYAINEEKLKKLRRLAATEREAALREQYRKEADAVLKEMDENPPLEDPQLIADDITSEKTAEVMSDNNERLGIFSAEGDLFANMAGRYNEKGGNFVIYLKGHPGDDVRVHRIGRKARHMSSPALTMDLTVQRDVIDEIGKNKQFKGRGLLARFLYSLCKSQVGYRARQETTILDSLIQKYKTHILTIAEAPLFLRTLSLTSEAQTSWNEFYNEIEASMKPGGELEHLCDWSSKLPGAVARIAGLLHFAKYGEDVESYPIEPRTVAAACAIGAYYREHAMAVFGLMREDARIESAKRILEYIEQHKPQTFKGRDILMNKNFFKTMDDIAPGIKVLIERGFIREQSQKQQKIGRPEAAVYEVNPSILNI